MYVPTTLAQPAGALAPAGIVTTVPPIGSPVSSAMSVHRAELNVLEGHQATVNGTLRPGLAGRVVMLQALDNHRWRTVARARTRSAGRFRLRYLAQRFPAAFVLHHGLSRHHSRRPDPAELGNQPLCHPIAEVLLIRIAG